MAVKRTDAAVADIQNYVRYLLRESSKSIAEKFLMRLEATAEKLSSMPHIGSRVESTNSRHSTLRLFSVKHHPNILILFRPLKSGGIEMVRVLHGARDIESILSRTDLDDASE